MAHDLALPHGTFRGCRQLPRRSVRTMVLCALTFCFPVVVRANDQRSHESQLHADKGMELARAGDLRGAEIELRRAIDLDPKNSLNLADLGGILVMQQRLEDANRFFEKSLLLNPNDIVIRRNLAANQWQLGQLQTAKRNLEQILKGKPGDKPTILLMGMIAENLKEYEAAAKWLGSVPELVQQRPESLAALARSYYNTGQKEKARETLNFLLAHPPEPQGMFLAAEVARDADDNELARALFTAIGSTYPDRAALGYELAQVNYRLNRFDDSQKLLLDLIATGHETSDIYNLLGWCYQKQKNLKEAVRAFDQAIDMKPTEESNYLDLGTILAEHNLPVALAVAKKAVERIPESYRGYLLKGMIEMRQGSNARAVQSFAKAVELKPDAAEASRGLAKAQLAAGMLPQAVSTFENGLRRFPRDALFHQEYALMLLKRVESGDLTVEARAVSLLESALALDDSLPESHYQLGNLYLTKRKPNEALEHLVTAANLDPRRSKIHYALARTYRRLNQEENASRELKIYGELKAEEEKRGSALAASDGSN
ncbi:MAG: hypothetical protein DMG06_07385 [Acidobacteria bacterium]|nr:MAG: hypothetical protein DMG06_07385 [Acidobacteriota bacterium]